MFKVAVCSQSWCPPFMYSLSYEPRKPVPLGPMFKKGVCMYWWCVGLSIYIVQDPEKQQEKQLFNKSDNTLLSCPSMVQREVEVSDIPEVGRVDGAAWFGSSPTGIYFGSLNIAQ